MSDSSEQLNLGYISAEDFKAIKEIWTAFQNDVREAGLKKPKLTFLGKFVAVLLPAFTMWVTTPLSAKAARLRAERELKKEEFRETVTDLIDKELLPNMRKAALSLMESFLEGEYGTS